MAHEGRSHGDFAAVVVLPPHIPQDQAGLANALQGHCLLELHALRSGASRSHIRVRRSAACSIPALICAACWVPFWGKRYAAYWSKGAGRQSSMYMQPRAPWTRAGPTLLHLPDKAKLLSVETLTESPRSTSLTREAPAAGPASPAGCPTPRKRSCGGLGAVEGPVGTAREAAFGCVQDASAEHHAAGASLTFAAGAAHVCPVVAVGCLSDAGCSAPGVY